MRARAARASAWPPCSSSRRAPPSQRRRPAPPVRRSRRPRSPRRPPSRTRRSRPSPSAARSKDEFAFELYGDQAPIATANFVALARCGFYDGIWFHRILAGFVIQAGDPGTKTHDAPYPGMGSGGAGYEFEIEPPAEGLDYVPYAVAMANNTQTNDSQFFVTLVDLSGRLELLYTIFGQVVDGTDVIDQIAAVPVANSQGSRWSSSRSNPSRFRADPSRFRQAVEARIARKALCNVKETKPRKALSKRNR